MGTMASMDCGCGYRAMAIIGASRREFAKVFKFPHYCEKCGVVSVDLLSDEVVCPTCGTNEVIRYGQKSEEKLGSILGVRAAFRNKVVQVHDERVTKPDGRKFASWSDYSITVGSHLCPACANFTLYIGTGDIGMFD